MFEINKKANSKGYQENVGEFICSLSNITNSNITLNF